MRKKSPAQQVSDANFAHFLQRKGWDGGVDWCVRVDGAEVKPSREHDPGAWVGHGPRPWSEWVLVGYSAEEAVRVADKRWPREGPIS